MKLSRDPAVWRGAVGSLIAGLAAVGALSTGQVDTVNGYVDGVLTVVVAAIPLIASVLTRGKVSPVSSEVRAGEPVLVYDHPSGQYVPDPAGRLDHDGEDWQ